MKKGILCLFLIISFALVGCGNEKDSSASSSTAKTNIVEKSSTTEETKESAVSSSSVTKTSGDFVSTAAEAYFDGTMLKGNSYSIKITSHKVIQPGQEGNEHGEQPVLAFWYDTMVSPNYDDSRSINPMTSWIGNFKAVQDNDPNKVNKLKVASLPDSQYRDSQSAEIKPGGTVPNAVAYELIDTTTPVELIAETMLGNELGKTTISIN